MCARYKIPGEEDIQRYTHARLAYETFEFKAIAYPGYDIPIVRESDGERIVEVRFWGYVVQRPHKRDPKKVVDTIYQNAKSETIDHWSLFKSDWEASRRCLIPVADFREPKKKIFHVLEDPQKHLLMMAGIYGTTQRKEHMRNAATMLTCRPNDFMEIYHDGEPRMPVIIQENHWAEYLSIDTPPDQAKKLCVPYRGELKDAGADQGR